MGNRLIYRFLRERPHEFAKTKELKKPLEIQYDELD